MSNEDYRSRFDRFAQEDYLKMLLKAKSEEIIPILFLDLMTRVNYIQGQVGILLADVERSEESASPIDPQLTNQVSVEVMDGAVDMANILKALMEYYEVQYGDKDKPQGTDSQKQA